jgi:hypothetical protein
MRQTGAERRETEFRRNKFFNTHVVRLPSRRTIADAAPWPKGNGAMAPTVQVNRSSRPLLLPYDQPMPSTSQCKKVYSLLQHGLCNISERPLKFAERRWVHAAAGLSVAGCRHASRALEWNAGFL